MKKNKIYKFPNKLSVQKTILYALIGGAFSALVCIIIMCASFSGRFLLSATEGVALWLMVYLSTICFYLYLKNIDAATIKNLVVIGVSVLVTLLLSAVFLRLIKSSIIPLSLAAMLCVLLLGKKEAYGVNLYMFVLLVLLLGVYSVFFAQKIDLSFLYQLVFKVACGIFVVFFYKSNFNRLKFISAGIFFGIASALLYFVFSMLYYGQAFVEAMSEAAWMLVAEIGSTLIALVLCPITEWAFRLDTNLQLLEYISFDQPLLKELAEKAPGTFNHSVQVGNMAERCAYAIGENVNLAKAAAYYHDVGKLQSPEFFTENQTGTYNPHDDLIFDTSVKIITRHTEIGYNMLTEKKFPKVIADVAREHHGESPLNYFYIKAQNITEGDVDSRAFRYPGPKPTTKISAIVMIADSVEAATRSMHISEREPLFALISKIIKEKREDGEFDDCDITMRQLGAIRDTLVECLVGSSHTRISYPTKKKA